MKKLRKGATAKKAGRLTILIVVLSIICIILLSIFPWISIKENDYVKEDLHFNFEMMKNSYNDQINGLANDLSLINILFWGLVILGLISFLGATIHASGKFSFFGYLLILAGCVTLILSILLINYQLAFLDKIGKIDSISASAIVTPFNYAYFIIIPSFIILIFSISYTWNMSLHSIQKYKILKEPKNDKKPKKIKEKKSTKKETKSIEKQQPKKEEPLKEVEESEQEQQPPEQITEDETSKEPETDEKQVEIEQWLVNEVQSLEKQALTDNASKIKETEEVTKISEQPSSGEASTQIKESELEPQNKSKELQVFPPEKTKIKSESSDEIHTSQSFEKALSSAIQKKHTEIKKLEPIEDEKPTKKPPKKKEPKKKKYNVRCPQCKHIFTFEKGDNPTKIKCPECGKEGVVK